MESHFPEYQVSYESYTTADTVVGEYTETIFPGEDVDVHVDEDD